MKKKKYILGIVICILITVLTGYSTADNILNNQTMNSIENNINIIDYVVQADCYADIRCAMKGDTLNYGPDLNTNTGVPTILVEHCFMNSSDIKFLDSDKDLKKIANADSKAIIDYFGLKLK